MHMQSTRLHFLLRILLFSTICIGVAVLSVWAAPSPEKLRQSIDDRAKELIQIQDEINIVQDEIGETGEQKTSLQGELQRIGYTINQLTLNIRSNEITIEKLGLEIEALHYDIADTRVKITEREEGISDTLKSIYEEGDESFLVTFLKYRSLAVGVFAIQSLRDLNDGLAVEMHEFKQLSEDLSAKLEDISVKKGGMETQRVTLTNRKYIIEDQQENRKDLLSTTQNKEKIYQQQLSDLEKKREEIAAEIEVMEADLRLRIDPASLPVPRPGVLAFPVPSGRITQGYGSTGFALANYRGKHHNGIDFGRFLGAEIVAAESGIVVGLDNQDNYCWGGAYGKYIVIRHDNNLTTLYGHMSRQVVSIGERVERGQLIGYMGRSGWATGPHLHFTVYDSATYTTRPSRVCGPMPIGGDIDPMKYLERI